MEVPPFDSADAYRVLGAKTGRLQHQTESFNTFLNVHVPQCLSEHPPVRVDDRIKRRQHVVSMDSVRWDRPTVVESNGERRTIDPGECHLRRLSYTVGMRITASYTILDEHGHAEHSIQFRDILFDHLPCMVGSQFCVGAVDPEALMVDVADQGGYFLRTGAEKVVVSQDTRKPNYPFVTANTKENLYTLEYRSWNEDKIRSTSTLYVQLQPAYVTTDALERRSAPVSVTVKIPYVKNAQSIATVFKLLDVDAADAMLSFFVHDDDPAWFKHACLDAVTADMDALVETRDAVVQRIGHDRSHSYSAARRRNRDAKRRKHERGEVLKQEIAKRKSHEQAAARKTARRQGRARRDGQRAGRSRSKRARRGSAGGSGSGSDMESGSGAESDGASNDASGLGSDSDAGLPAPPDEAEPAPTEGQWSSFRMRPSGPRKPCTLSAAELGLQRSRRQVDGLLNSEFFPHQGYSPDDIPAKRALFGQCVRKLLRVYFGFQAPDDQDHYMHRRVQTAMPLMALLYRYHYTQWVRRLASRIRQDLERGAQFVNVHNMLHAKIGNNLMQALGQGNFGMYRGQSNLDGVAQVLSRIEPHSATGHAMRVNNPVNKEGRATKPKLLHPSSLGIVCPWETPEGQACGLNRNLTLTSGIRVGYPTALLKATVLSLGLVAEGRAHVSSGQLGASEAPVFVSGVLVGTTRTAAGLTAQLRQLRAVQDIPFDVSVYHAQGVGACCAAGEVHVNGDAGSYHWPLLRTDRLAALRATLDTVTNDDALWPALVGCGAIEAINKDEEEACVRAALSWDDLRRSPPGTYTHVVIDPSQLCSLFSSRVPNLEFNQAPRVTYAAAMGKQAIGRAMTNQRMRVDTSTHALWYAERPLVTTLTDERLDSGMVAGFNCVVAININDGYAVEDAIILNQASVDRGMARSARRTTTRELVRTTQKHEVEVLGLPPAGCHSTLHADYSKVDPRTGVVRPGTRVAQDTVLISKHAVMHSRRGEARVKADGRAETVEVDHEQCRDRSKAHRLDEPGVVEDVVFSQTLHGEPTVRVKVRSMRVPQVGDKFASRYGQKGTVGAIYPAVDMPFGAATGLTPDIIINAHCMPSRMTIGHMIEMIQGALAALRGESVDATPFAVSKDSQSDPDRDAVVRRLGEALAEAGLSSDGTQEMIDGRTGCPLTMPVFVAPMTYQRLKHMTEDKFQARARGPISFRTRQPLEGRQKHGGQRFGEMERDNLLSHGATAFLQDRLMISSDKAEVPVCVQCGNIAQPAKQRSSGEDVLAATEHSRRPFCQTCLTYDTVKYEVMPFAYKTVTQVMQAMHIKGAFEYEPESLPRPPSPEASSIESAPA